MCVPSLQFNEVRFNKQTSKHLTKKRENRIRTMKNANKTSFIVIVTLWLNVWLMRCFVDADSMNLFSLFAYLIRIDVNEEMGTWSFKLFCLPFKWWYLVATVAGLYAWYTFYTIKIWFIHFIWIDIGSFGLPTMCVVCSVYIFLCQ